MPGGLVNLMVGDGLMAVFGAPAQRWILVDGAAHDELGDEFPLTPLGDQMLKGKSESIRVFAVDN